MPSQSQMHSASSSPPLSLQRRLQILADIDNDEEDEEQEQEDSEHAGSQRRRSYDSDEDEEDEYILVKSSDIRKEVQCPICLGIIRKTRTVMECLHRFCRECIDKAMRLGNNECPACRTHCASRRSLRDDPNYDALIAAIYPDLDKFEEEELAFHEEDKLRNDQIQASIAETQRRQSEAIAKRKNAKANAAATSKKPEERYQNGQNYIIENESRGKRKRRNCSSDPDEDSAVKVSSTEAEDDESLSKRVKRSSVETVSRNDNTIKVSPPEVGVDESLNRRVKRSSIETVSRNDSTIKVSSTEVQVDENLNRRMRRSSIETFSRNDSTVKVPSNEVVSRNNSTIRVPSTEVLSRNDSTVKVTSTEVAGKSDSTEKVLATDVVGRNDNIIKIPYLSRNDSTVKAPSTEVVGTNDSSIKVPYLSRNDSTVKVLSTEAVGRNDSTVKFSSSEIVDIDDNTVKVPSTEVASTNDSTINLPSTEVQDADSLNKKENVPSTEKDSKNDSTEKFNEINCDNAAKENCPTGVNTEQNEACKGKTINPGGLVWGKACVRTSMRYGNLGNSNGRNSKKSRAARMVQYLLTKARKEDESMFEVHLTMFPFKNNPPLPRLEKPHLCCGPTVTIMKLCKLLALELQLPINEIEIVLERRDRLIESTPKNHSGKRKNTGAEDEGTVVILEQEMTVSTILEHFPELRGSLVLMYRYKQKFLHRSSNSTNSRESPSCRDQGSPEFSQSGEFLSLAKSLSGFKL